MKRPNPTRSSASKESVTAARTVWCPLRGDTDVERCFTCPHLESAEQRGDNTIVECHPARSRVSDGELLAGLRV
jgi:hypothetical protein